MSVEVVRAKLGEDAKLVTIEKIGEYVTVQLKEYDPTKIVWDRVNGKLRAQGGEWMGGLGKESHWRIPVSGVATEPTQDKKALLVKDALEYLITIQEQATNIHKQLEPILMQLEILKEKLKELQQK